MYTQPHFYIGTSMSQSIHIQALHFYGKLVGIYWTQSIHNLISIYTIFELIIYIPDYV